MSQNFLSQVQQEHREAFIRQRRSLFIVSLVLLFAETSELTLSKLNIFGNELLIRHPIVVNVFLWVAWGYWLARFLQYLGHVRGLTEILDTYRDRLDGWVRELVRRRATPKCLSPNNYYFKDISTRSLWQWHVLHGESVPVEGPPRTHREEDRVTILNFGDLLVPRIRAWLYVVLGTRSVTEYVLPLLVAVVPVGYLIYLLC